MYARLRTFLLIGTVLGTSLLGAPSAYANHCPPQPTQPDDWCHQATPAPTPRPTPAPTAQPTPQPTAVVTPTPRPATPRPTARTTPRPTRRPSSSTPVPPRATDDPSGSPSPTPLDLDLDPVESPRILIQGPFDTPEPDETEEIEVTTAAQTTSAGFWAGLLLGVVVGFLIRSVIPALRGRKKKQQIFG